MHFLHIHMNMHTYMFSACVHTHTHLHLWFMHGLLCDILGGFFILVLPQVPPVCSVRYLSIMSAPGFFLGSCRLLHFFLFPCFFPCFVKRLDWSQDWRTKRALNRWEIVGGMLKPMRRVGGQFWKSELDVKLTENCLIKCDFVEQKAKFVSRLNSVMFIYRQKKRNQQVVSQCQACVKLLCFEMEQLY